MINNMEQLQSNKAALIVAVLVPILIGWLGVQAQFWLGAVIASPLGLLPALLVGVIASSKVNFESTRSKYIFISTYILAVLIVLFLVSLLTSCANGDCI